MDVTNNFINAMMKCNAVRKFYAPSDAKKDADGCVGVGDYDINMAATSNINLADGVVNSTRSAANQYAGYYVGNTYALRGQAGSYGLVGAATGTGGVGVRGDASVPSGWGGYFTGINGALGQTANGYGVQGNATGNGYGVVGSANGSGYAVYGVGYNTNNWGGVFTSPNYGVYGAGATYGVYSDGPLCINGACITQWSGYYTLAGAYYGGSMSRSNSSGRGMMVMVSGGTNPYCGGNWANHFDLSGYVNGSRITFTNNANDERSKAGAITFYVPNGSSYAVYSQPYACGGGYFYVSEAVI